MHLRSAGALAYEHVGSAGKDTMLSSYMLLSVFVCVGYSEAVHTRERNCECVYVLLPVCVYVLLPGREGGRVHEAGVEVLHTRRDAVDSLSPHRYLPGGLPRPVHMQTHGRMERSESAAYITKCMHAQARTCTSAG